MIDLHSHSHNSGDANTPVSEMIAAAKRAGVDIFAITDHVEINRFFSEAHYGGRIGNYKYETYDDCLAFEKTMFENTACKETETDIKFLCGIELGQATHDLGVASSAINDVRLDFVIASMHQLPKMDDFAFLDYSTYSDEALHNLCRAYFEELLKLAEWGQFDVLGHLTYILRYMEGNAGRIVNMDEFEEIIRAIYRTLIDKNKGIEINSSGLRQKYGKTFPDYKWVQLFRDMGGEIITLGSDSHVPADVGTGIKEAETLAKAAGFTHLTYFEKRVPHFIPIK